MRPFPSPSNQCKRLVALLLNIPQPIILKVMTDPHAKSGHLEIIAAQAIYNINISVTIYNQHGQIFPATPSPNSCNVIY